MNEPVAPALAAQPTEPDPLKCPKCGTELSRRALHMTCLTCLEGEYIKHLGEVERNRVLHGATRKILFELARDQHRRQHLVFAGDPTRAYCGQHVTEPIKRRARVDRFTLPDSVCTACRTASGTLWAVQEEHR